MNHQEFTALFRQIAEKHVDIRHSEAEQHFARIVITRDPFLDSRGQIAEFLESAVSRLKSPVMLISSYTSDYGDSQDDHVRKLLTARMIILKATRKGKFAEEEAAYTDTEKIGEECLAYLGNYLEDHPQKGMLVWNNLGSEKLSNITDRYFCGTGFTVSILSNSNPHVSYNPEKFV